MQFQSIPGLAGRLFGGAAGASDLRRAQGHAHAHAQQGPGSRCGGVSPAAPPEAVKCPRCESTNTKFCYYNNYNLSQPRHFCKSCRRYWTKGGVLRNVPVGGGCRKTKRASSSSSSPSSAATSAPSTPTSGSGDAAANKNPRRASASSPRSNSNSGSASPTATVATTPTPTATTTPTTPATPSSNSSVAASFTTSSHHHHSNPFSTIDVVAPPAPIFADQAAALASLFAPPPPPPLPVFTFAAQPKVEAPTTPSELELQLVAGQDASAAAAPCSSSMVVSEDMAPFASLDDAAGIFELGDAASAAAYWNAGSCWTDVQDPSMYLP